MSYLDLYQSSTLQDANVHQVQSDEETNTAAAVAPVQAQYRHHYLTSILAEEIVAALSTTQAIDMSNNAIDQLPRTVSPILIALDVSHNVIERPIVLSARYQLIELNMSNNKILDLKGLSLLVSLEFLDVSSNAISLLEGLENMKRLKVLKLQHNKISSFQSLRLLTYNICLKDVRLEGNAIVDDPYFKVKLINYIPNLKYLDGSTVWRRTSLQSRVVNDDLQYSDLCARTPASVQKYAKLSKRSSHLHPAHDMMQDLSGSMLTMQGLRAFNKQQVDVATPVRGYNRPLSEQTPLPQGLTYLGLTDSMKSNQYARSSPERSLFHASTKEGTEEKSDIDLLPVHLQTMLRKHLRAYESPRRSVRAGVSSPTKKMSQGTAAPSFCNKSENSPIRTGQNNQEVPPRSRSALPWRNPPSLAPNLDVRFKSRRNGDSDSVSMVTTEMEASRNNAFGGSRATSTTRADQRQFNGSMLAAPQAQRSQLIKAGEASQSLKLSRSPETASPSRESPAKATPASANISTVYSGQWMNPELNSAIKARASDLFDNNLNQMESTMNSSLFVLQKSFDADHKRGRSENGSVASSSAQQRGRPGTRQDLQLTVTSDSGARSVSSNLRSVTPTKASIIRANYTSDMIRATQMSESQARALNESRTFSRASSRSGSPHQERNPAYTYLQGTSSPVRRREELADIPSYSVRTQPFSPQSTPRRRSKSPNKNSRSSSPPRVSSTARILDVYKEMPQEAPQQQHHKRVQHSKKVPHYATSKHEVYPAEAYPPSEAHEPEGRNNLHIKVPHAGSKQAHKQPHLPAQRHAPQRQHHTGSPPRRRSPSQQRASRTYSDESKSRDQLDDAPPPPPISAGDDSPYRRFLQLRERLSSKYVQSAVETGEFFEPVRSSASVRTMEPTRGVSQVVDVHESSGGIVEMKGQEVHESQTGHVLSVSQPLQQTQLFIPASGQDTVRDSLPPPPPPQELSFEELKEQYQRQYHVEYEKQRQEHENLHRNIKSGAALDSPSPADSSSHKPPDSLMHKNLPAGTIVAPPNVPPRSAGYEALFDLIHQRRSVLEKITQPRDLSPDRARHLSPEKERIGGAINHLKHRQAASVNVIQSVTRERTVPAPVHNGLLQVSLSTPALYPSISNYASMAQSNPSDSVQGALGMMQNSFMNRLTSNNPYMAPTDGQHLSPAVFASAPSPPATFPLAGSAPLVGTRFQGVTNLMGSYPAPPPYVPHGPPSPSLPSSSLVHVIPACNTSVIPPQIGGEDRSAITVPAVSALGGVPPMAGNGSLAQAIRDLQAKQTRDISALKRQ